MKKLFYFGALAIALIASSCSGNGGANASKEGFDTLFTKAQADTFLTSFATMVGNSMRQQLAQAQEMDPSFSKEEFVKGVQYTYAGDTTTSYRYGMQIGAQLLNEITRFNQQGLDVDKAMILNTFKKTFLADSVNTQEVMLNEEVYRKYQREFQEAVRLYERAKILNSEECKANEQAGIDYIENWRTSDQDVVVTATGVAYKIENPGEDEKISTKSRVMMAYTAANLDGEVFDKMDTNNLRPTLVSTRVPGLQEVLVLLGKGGKATVAVPGSAAYGIDNMRRFNLGPNQPVIFNVEIVDIPADK